MFRSDLLLLPNHFPSLSIQAKLKTILDVMTGRVYIYIYMYLRFIQMNELGQKQQSAFIAHLANIFQNAMYSNINKSDVMG